MPRELRKVNRYLNGGMKINRKRMEEWSQEVGCKLRMSVRFAEKLSEQKQNPQASYPDDEAADVDAQGTLRITGSSDVAMLQSVPKHTPQTPKELARILREAPLLCPFGEDFEDAGINEMTPRPLNTLHGDVSRWLALIELDGFALGYGHAFQGKVILPYCYSKLVQEIVKVRSTGPRSNAITGVEDLAASLSKNAVFNDAVALHDLMLLALPVEARQKYNPFGNGDAVQPAPLSKEAATTQRGAHKATAATDADVQSARETSNRQRLMLMLRPLLRTQCQQPTPIVGAQRKRGTMLVVLALATMWTWT